MRQRVLTFLLLFFLMIDQLPIDLWGASGPLLRIKCLNARNEIYRILRETNYVEVCCCKGNRLSVVKTRNDVVV